MADTLLQSKIYGSFTKTKIKSIIFKKLNIGQKDIDNRETYLKSDYERLKRGYLTQ